MIQTKNPWDRDGDRHKAVNKAIMEMIAMDIQPFSIVEDAGFKNLLGLLQPKYKIPSRKFFTETMLPDLYNSIKTKIKTELDNASDISFTCDAWSSTNSVHSLLSLTAHFLQECQPKFAILSVRPIIGSHSAETFKNLFRETIEEFEIRNDKIFLCVRDAAEVMIKMCTELQIRSVDCFAHKLNLAIWDGLRILENDNNLKSLIERIKKFVRRLKKSAIRREEFTNIQKLHELPPLNLVKECEVRWSSTYDMLERFLFNETAIRILCAQDPTFPKFDENDFLTISALKEILHPIYAATNLVQGRKTTISAVIPLYRVISHALNKEHGKYPAITTAINDGLTKRMAEKRDAAGRIKRAAWFENRDLILATIIDARFKMIYFDSERRQEYSEWLIMEAEKSVQIEARRSDSSNGQSTNQPTTIDNLFADFEKDAQQTELYDSPLPSPQEINVHQKAELEVTEYLRAKRLNINDDPFIYRSGENAAKWPLLTILAQRYFSAPATSAESERLFSTAGQIVSKLRTKLLASNVEKLLFLHHNLKFYDSNG